MANNHLKDYGDEGLAYTLQQLDQASISYIGAGLNQKDAHNYFEITFEAKHYAILMVIGIETQPIWIMTFMR